MNNVVWGQYKAADYPLKHFYYEEIPERVKKVLFDLNQRKIAVFRGGIAFVFLLNKTDYKLKDLDMLAYDGNRDEIIDVLSDSDIVYINKNTFGDTVITAFWEDNQEYFKLDVLLNCELPKLNEIVFNTTSVTTVSASYLWRNRLEKIAEKEIRGHSVEKTKNHYNAARVLSLYLTEYRTEICQEDVDKIANRLNEIEFTLTDIISQTDIEQFIKIQLDIFGR